MLYGYPLHGTGNADLRNGVDGVGNKLGFPYNLGINLPAEDV